MNRSGSSPAIRRDRRIALAYDRRWRAVHLSAHISKDEADAFANLTTAQFNLLVREIDPTPVSVSARASRPAWRQLLGKFAGWLGEGGLMCSATIGMAYGAVPNIWFHPYWPDTTEWDRQQPDPNE